MGQGGVALTYIIDSRQRHTHILLSLVGLHKINLLRGLAQRLPILNVDDVFSWQVRGVRQRFHEGLIFAVVIDYNAFVGRWDSR